MQLAQLVMMIMCKPGQMAVVSSCQGQTWHLPRKSFMVILRSLWYLHSLLLTCVAGGVAGSCGAAGPTFRRIDGEWASYWNWAVNGAVSQSPSTLAHESQGQNLQFCVWMPVLFDPVSNTQESEIPSIMIAADATVIDRTVYVEHLLLESNPKCFISHSPTYLILSIMKYHIY